MTSVKTVSSASQASGSLMASGESEHRLSCLIHNKGYSTNGSFPVIEGPSLKNEIEEINKKELRGLGALE